jgi:hypothetical protein
MQLHLHHALIGKSYSLIIRKIRLGGESQESRWPSSALFAPDGHETDASTTATSSYAGLRESEEGIWERAAAKKV